MRRSLPSLSFTRSEFQDGHWLECAGEWLVGWPPATLLPYGEPNVTKPAVVRLLMTLWISVAVAGCGTSSRQGTLLLARHGASAFVPADDAAPMPFPDPPLTAAGEGEASRLAGLARAQGIRWIVSSPLLRARQTARIVADSLGLDVTIDSGLVEFNFGDLMGRDWSKSPYREQIDSVLANPAARRPGGESMMGFSERVTAATRRISVAAHGRTTLVVAHGMTNRAIVGLARGEAPGVTARTGSQGPGVVYRLSLPVRAGTRVDSVRF